MNENLKKGENRVLFSTIALLVIGIILAISPLTMVHILITLISLFLIGLGGYFLYDYIRTNKDERVSSMSLVFGILVIAVGIFLLVYKDFPVNLISILIGIIVFVKGIYKLQISLNMRSLTDKWKYNFLIAILTITLGVILIIYPNKSSEVFLRIIGIIMIVGSLGDLIGSTYVSRSIKVSEEDKKSDVIDIKYEDKESKNSKEKDK